MLVGYCVVYCLRIGCFVRLVKSFVVLILLYCAFIMLLTVLFSTWLEIVLFS